jgi:anti-sigma regulatory factor (Ser/Thr protein kinase)
VAGVAHVHRPSLPVRSGIEIRIEVPLDVFDFRRAVRVLATSHGFDRYGCGALELVASELATNVLKHAQRGTASAGAFEHAQRGLGLRIETRDEGPEIEDLEQAVADGYSGRRLLEPEEFYGRRGIGAGLGAIRRLSHELQYTRMPRGNLFTVVRYRTG